MRAISNNISYGRVTINMNGGTRLASSPGLLGSGTVSRVGERGKFTLMCGDVHISGLVLAADEWADTGIGTIAAVSEPVLARR